MSQLYAGVSVANFSSQYGNCSVMDEERWSLAYPAFYWNYRLRGASSVINGLWTDTYGGLWPRSSLDSDCTASVGNMIGLDSMDVSGDWSPWELGYSGTIRLLFLSGYVKDANGNIVGGAVVTSFRTSDGALGGTTITDSNGWYQCPTTLGAVAHYLIAYLTGPPDTEGTTVNTLVPS